MANYKGIDVEDSVRMMLPHMPLIEEYRERLQTLQAVWDNLNLLGQLSGTTAEIGQTREAFSNLTGELLNNLAARTLAKREQEMKAKSQVVIDILVRNLFERTADIGFLCTDEELRRFAAAPGDPSPLQQRFREYVRKYSVYEDVVLLSTNGEILARLKSDGRATTIRESWVGEASHTSAAYVEAYGHSTLFPDQPRSLIYAYRIVSPQGQTLGVLALCFRFDDEMAHIFRSLSQANDPGLLVLLDTDGQVIASSDPWQVPVGAPLAVTPNRLQSLRFAGRSYIAFASDSKGYQGYMGPGWRGLVMMPMDMAFEITDDDHKDAGDAALLASVLSGGRAFPESLRAIPVKAAAIQRDLSRAVWNGTVRQSVSTTSINANFSKILLREISRVGMSMREVFSQSIGNLQSTVISSLLADCQFFAALAIDIMDRNLYERANDCRWWALDSKIRQFMAEYPAPGRLDGLQKVIGYINSLYTVYDNILLFDTEGRIISVANPVYAELIGSQLNEPWIAECLALRESQHYAVSSFAHTPLYAGRPTYIYLATLRSSDDARVTGGIAIVFDSEPQFSAMLADALPGDATGKAVADSFAVFLNSDSTVVAASGGRYRPGDRLALPADLLAPPPEGHSRLMVVDGQVMAVGSRLSTGYREYKGGEDSYRNPVTAAVFIPLGPHDPDAKIAPVARDTAARRSVVAADLATTEIATFHLGGHWLGLPVGAVVEAVELTGAVCLPNAPREIYGAQIYRNQSLPIYNLHAALGVALSPDASLVRQVVVVRGENQGYFGILVDALGEILEVPSGDIEDLSNIYVGISSVLASIVKTSPDHGNVMLVLISVASMCEHLRGKAELLPSGD